MGSVPAQREMKISSFRFWCNQIYSLHFSDFRIANENKHLETTSYGPYHFNMSRFWITALRWKGFWKRHC